MSCWSGHTSCCTWTRSPDYAAINEAVGQARRSGFNALNKVVNGVLRNVQRHIVERVDWSDTLPSRRAIRSSHDRASILDIDLLADRKQDLVGYLSIATSLPTEIVTRWIRTFGKEQAEQMCWASQWRPPVVLRPNGLKTDGKGLLRALAEEDIAGEPGQSLRRGLRRPVPVGSRIGRPSRVASARCRM